MTQLLQLKIKLKASLMKIQENTLKDNINSEKINIPVQLCALFANMDYIWL